MVVGKKHDKNSELLQLSAFPSLCHQCFASECERMRYPKHAQILKSQPLPYVVKSDLAMSSNGSLFNRSADRTSSHQIKRQISSKQPLPGEESSNECVK